MGFVVPPNFFLSFTFKLTKQPYSPLKFKHSMTDPTENDLNRPRLFKVLPTGSYARIVDGDKEYCSKFIQLFINLRKILISKNHILYELVMKVAVNWMNRQQDRVQEVAATVQDLLYSLQTFLEGREYPDIYLDKDKDSAWRWQFQTQSPGPDGDRNHQVHIDVALACAVNHSLITGTRNPLATFFLVSILYHEAAHNAVMRLLPFVVDTPTMGGESAGKSGDAFETLFFGAVLVPVLSKDAPADYSRIHRIEGLKNGEYYPINMELLINFVDGVLETAGSTWDGIPPLFPNISTTTPAALASDEIRSKTCSGSVPASSYQHSVGLGPTMGQAEYRKRIDKCVRHT
ncbi:hypothetical protein E1B28_006076 [Marasmius oreades]|uniref:Uncharacterized protein n=1 Tax=Marasmius oreades TaxID=181124 RepID=A0A9P7UW07_9AGAR|nr:uncharacterized protein E1B28_006076 [Marasmius oreades]KAG7095311.1 hypothetical protein E1B28_006076 [Marasmius oreades]